MCACIHKATIYNNFYHPPKNVHKPTHTRTNTQTENQLEFLSVLWFSASLNLIDIKWPFNLCRQSDFMEPWRLSLFIVTRQQRQRQTNIDNGDENQQKTNKNKKQYHQIIWRNKNFTIIYFYGFINHSSAIIYHSYYYDLNRLLAGCFLC